MHPLTKKIVNCFIEEGVDVFYFLANLKRQALLRGEEINEAEIDNFASYTSDALRVIIDQAEEQFAQATLLAHFVLAIDAIHQQRSRWSNHTIRLVRFALRDYSSSEVKALARKLKKESRQTTSGQHQT
jgi:hypothetical protein